MLREERQAKILEIISKQEIETQEELCAALNELHYAVTQATVSRDIKQLRLFKIKGTTKKHRYASLTESDTGNALPIKMRNMFRESVVAIRSAGNLVVVKTLSGNASNAGAVLDKLNHEEVVGTVAGDDTLFAACESVESAIAVAKELNEILK